jgi:hypothetical protein
MAGVAGVPEGEGSRVSARIVDDSASRPSRSRARTGGIFRTASIIVTYCSVIRLPMVTFQFVVFIRIEHCLTLGQLIRIQNLSLDVRVC